MERQYRQLGTYNRMRIITAIEKILVENGCKILRTHFDKPLEIQCYTSLDAPKDVMEKVDKLPIINVFGEHLHLNFMHENYYIHFEFDDNPFFPTHYIKIKVDENGNYIGKRLGYTTDDNMKDTLDVTLDYDGIWKVIDDEIIEAMAQDFYDKIKDYIKYGKENEIDSVKRRVRNCFNESYHYETIYDKTKCSIYYNNRTFNHQYIEKED